MEALKQEIRKLEGGIERRIDEIGRIVIPIEFRKKEMKNVMFQILDNCLVIRETENGEEGNIEIDELGRIKIKSELLEQLRWTQGDRIEIIPFKEYIIFRSIDNHVCIFCKKQDYLVEYRKKYICHECKKKIVEGNFNV